MSASVESSNSGPFPVGSFNGCTCTLIEEGKERSIAVTGCAERNGGNKLVLISDGGAIAKLALDDNGNWYSLGKPLVINLATGKRMICACKPQPQAAPQP